MSLLGRVEGERTQAGLPRRGQDLNSGPTDGERRMKPQVSGRVMTRIATEPRALAARSARPSSSAVGVEARVLDGRVGARGEQPFDQTAVADRHGCVQRGLPLVLQRHVGTAECVHVEAEPYQQLDRFRVGSGGRPHDQPRPRRARPFDQLGRRRQRSRLIAAQDGGNEGIEVVEPGRGGPVRFEHRDHRGVAREGGELDRGSSIGERCIGIDFVREQQAHPVALVVHHRPSQLTAHELLGRLDRVAEPRSPGPSVPAAEQKTVVTDSQKKKTEIYFDKHLYPYMKLYSDGTMEYTSYNNVADASKQLVNKYGEVTRKTDRNGKSISYDYYDNGTIKNEYLNDILLKLMNMIVIIT